MRCIMNDAEAIQFVHQRDAFGGQRPRLASAAGKSRALPRQTDDSESRFEPGEHIRRCPPVKDSRLPHVVDLVAVAVTVEVTFVVVDAEDLLDVAVRELVVLVVLFVVDVFGGAAGPLGRARAIWRAGWFLSAATRR